MRTRLPPYLFTVVVCAFAAWSAACSPGEEGVTDAQATQDAQTSTTDTGVVDTGVDDDAGVDDLGQTDSGPSDAGLEDASPGRFAVLGTVIGLEGEGLSLTLRVGGSDEVLAVSAATFAFPNLLDDGTAYEVSVLAQPIVPIQACSVSNGTGTITGADASIEVRCVTASARFLVSSDQQQLFVSAAEPSGFARPWRRIPIADSPLQVALDAHATQSWIFRQTTDGIETLTVAPDGRVTSTSNLATPAGRSLAVRTMASGQRAFSLANLSGSGVVSTLDVAADGALTLTSTTPATFAGFPEDIVLDPGGRLLWGLARILGQQVGAVYPFVIDPSGALRPSSPASISTPSATAIAYVPRADLMLLAGADGNVYQYRVDADGLLTALATPSVVVGSPGGYDVVAEPSGRFAYVSSVADNTVSAFEISIDGLTAIGSVDAGGRPDKLVADPSGRSIAVLHGGFPGAAIAHFAIGASGALTFLGVSPAPSVGGNLAIVRGAPLALDAEHVIVQQRLAPLEYRLRRFDIDGQGQLVPGSEADVVNGFGDLGVTSDPSGENVYATAHRASGDGQDLVEFDARAGALAPLTPSVGPLSLVDGWVVFGPRGNLHLERYAATPVDGRLPQTLTTSPDAYGLLTPPVFDPAGRFAWIPDTAGLFGPTPSIDRLPIAEITMSALSFEGEIVVSRDGRFAWGVPFVIGVAELTPMQIDSQTGALTAQTPLMLPGDVRAAAVHPSGRFLFVAGIGEVWSFEIGADGALTSVGTAMSPNAGSFRQLIVSRSGRYLYAMANENNAQTNQFAINSDGTLTPLVPFSIPMWSVDAVASGTWR